MTDGKGSPPFRIELGLRGEAGAVGPARRDGQRLQEQVVSRGPWQGRQLGSAGGVMLSSD